MNPLSSSPLSALARFAGVAAVLGGVGAFLLGPPGLRGAEGPPAGVPVLSELGARRVAHPAAARAAAVRRGSRRPRTPNSTAGLMGEARLVSWLTPPPSPLLRAIPLRPGVTPAELDGLYIGGVDYEDPSGGAVPLVWVGDAGERWLSPSFRVADFVTHDGAPFARISPRLVGGLERLREAAGALAIVSGYRHRAYNSAVGGASESQHMAGQAADVWSPAQSPLDLARLALETMGCDVGLGLGPNSLHVDVRGELATWTYEGAALPGPAFDAWALAQCGRPVPPALAEAAAAAWFERAAPADSAAQAGPADLLARHQADLAAAAAAAFPVHGPGAVVLDLRAGVPPHEAVRFVRAGSAEADSLGLAALIAWCTRRGAEYFAYAIFPADGAAPLTGVTSASAPALPARPAPPAAVPTSGAAGADIPGADVPGGDVPGADVPEAGWTIVVASHPDPAAAAASAERIEADLGEPGEPVFVLPADGGGPFRVGVGHFETAEAAQRALRGRPGDFPGDAWVLPL